MFKISKQDILRSLGYHCTDYHCMKQKPTETLFTMITIWLSKLMFIFG